MCVCGAPGPFSLLCGLQQAKSGSLAVVAIGTYVCLQDPDMPYRLGPASSQGSRPDVTPERVSFYLGNRDAPGLDSAYS